MSASNLQRQDVAFLENDRHGAKPAVGRSHKSTATNPTSIHLSRRLRATQGRQCIGPVANFLKYIMDFALALCACIVTLPLICLIALAVKIDSRGPVFFRQKRPGRNGRDFYILKFRTMHVDKTDRFEMFTPEQQTEFEMFGKVKEDPRITRLGAWLRRCSLDELPQFWNVLKGDMSLIGPRPYLQTQLDNTGKVHQAIFQVKPGITGLWQVSGRNAISHRGRLCLDAYYVRNWTPLLDLYILLRTPMAVVGKTGAH